MYLNAERKLEICLLDTDAPSIHIRINRESSLTKDNNSEGMMRYGPF